MRRVLFTAFLSLTAFSVLGGNFLPVTAPSIAGEVGDFETRAGASRAPRSFVPTGATRLSAEPIAATVLQGLPPAPADADREHAPTSSLDQVAPIEVREDSADVARVVDTREPRFVSTWVELPMAALHYFGLAGAEMVRTAEEVAAERSPAAPERHSLSDSRLPNAVASRLDVPNTTFSSRRTESLPQAPTAFNTETHNLASSTIASLEDDRPETAQIERADAPVATETIVAAAEAPSGDFTRQRIVAEPQTPVYAAPESTTARHIAFSDPWLIEEERGPSAAADASRSSFSVLNFIAAVQAPPAAIFQRLRFVPEPHAPARFATAVADDDHTAVDNAIVALDERGPAVAPEDGSVLARFVEAVMELPSAIFSPRALVDAPAAPAPVAYAANGHESDSVTGASAPDDRGDIIAADKTRASVSSEIVSSVIEAPSAAIDASRVRDLFAAPVTITAKSTMSTAMLTPMSRNEPADAPLTSESTMLATNSSDLTTQFDRAIAPIAAAERVAPAQPVLISGRPEFSMDLLKPLNATSVNPFAKLTAQEELAAIQRRDGFCDPNWIGPPIRFSQTVELKLEDLINQLHQRFGVNFIVGKGVAQLPMNVKAGSIPWNVLLRSLLFVSGVRARCIDASTIELIENANIASLQDMADVETRFVKLKFLQRTGSGSVDIANRSQGSNQGGQGGGCGGSSQGGSSGSIGGGGGGGQQQGSTASQLTNNKYDKLIVEIEKILGLRSMTESSAGGQGNNQGGGVQQAQEVIRTNRFVTEIPGRNILAIRATKEEHALIDEFIRRADRAPFQVVIKGLVYTANEDRIQDIGVQSSVIVGTANQRTLGGVTSQPGPDAPTSPIEPTTPGQPNPGGVRTLGTGFLQPSGLGDGIFGFSAILGTAQFSVQATAFQQNGIISVKSRPFSTVLDGLCTTLSVGTKLPIVIDSSLGGEGGVEILNADNLLAVTPYVVDDDNGNPVAVTLELHLQANVIDSSISARGVPAVNSKNIQTQLLLEESKTAILGGFSVDQDSKTVTKVPGLGDIPILGELFKRRFRDKRLSRLYFAISVEVLPYPEPIRPVNVPGATTDPPSITPEMKKRADKAEPDQVIAVPTPKGP